MTEASIVPLVNYRDRYISLLNALGIECTSATVSGIDHDEALSHAVNLKRIGEEIPETCSGTLHSVIAAAKATGYRSKLRDMIASASQKAVELSESGRGSPLTHLFGGTEHAPTDGYIHGLDKVFEIMAAADAARGTDASSASAAERLLEIVRHGHGDTVLALVDAARRLPAGEWWLDQNNPWRLMLDLSAVAEDDDLRSQDGSVSVMTLFDTEDGERGTVGDGQPAHLKAILRVLEAASALHRPQQDSTKASVVELVRRDPK